MSLLVVASSSPLQEPTRLPLNETTREHSGKVEDKVMEELNANKERPCRLSVFRFLLSGQDHIDMYRCTGGDTKTQSHYGDLPHQINRCQTPHPPLGELYPKREWEEQIQINCFMNSENKWRGIRMNSNLWKVVLIRRLLYCALNVRQIISMSSSFITFEGFQELASH